MQPTPLAAKDIMTTKLVTLTPKMDAFDAIGLLLKNKISGAPVIDEHRRLLGVFTEKCSLSVLVEGAYEQLPATEVEAFMDRDPETIGPETDVLSIAQKFLSTSSRRLPVLEDGKLVGQISRRDVLRAVHDLSAVAPNKNQALLYVSSLVGRDEAPIS